MTLSEIITRAARMNGTLADGETLQPGEADTGLMVAQGVIYDITAKLAPLRDIVITDDYTAEENDRITQSGGTYTITKPTTIADSSQASGYRVPKNGACVVITGATPEQWIYVAEFGAWKQIDGLALSSANPLGSTHDEDLAAMISLRLAPELPGMVPQLVAQLAEQGRRAIRQRFRQSRAVTIDPVLTRSYRFDQGTV